MPDISLYALLDAGTLGPDELPGLARLAARNGATILQYRDKTGTTREMVERARAISCALKGLHVPLLVNDRADVALASGADGVHLGRDDLKPQEARQILGPGAIVGLTVKSEADAGAAIAAPIDYACIGGVFETLSKKNPDPPVGLEGLARLREKLRDARPDLPVSAIAGIDLSRIPGVMAAGADGVAVISALFGASDPAQAARALRAAVDEARRSHAR